jgi:hypothetical protein
MKLYALEMQLVQSVQLFERAGGMAFTSDILKCTDEDGGYFLCQVTFHVGGKVVLHNVQIWGFEYPKQLVEHVSDSSM